MNPIARWTVGPVKEAGLDCLRRSVKKFAEVYPEFDRVVCFNQIEEASLKSIPALLINQNMTDGTLDRKPLDGYQVHWKLYPARLAIMRHEIAIDNDIVIEKRLPEIEEFLNNDKTLVYEGRHRLFGVFDNHVKPGLQVNSGIYGAPPMFDLNCRINNLIRSQDWEGKFDEQGAIAAVLTDEDYIMIPQSRLPIVEETESLLKTEGQCGYHFVGINYFPTHKGWQEYMSMC
jgi:hypothetical protein